MDPEGRPHSSRREEGEEESAIPRDLYYFRGGLDPE
jgi:hypothetical protein